MKFKNHIFLISAGLTFISLLVLIPSVSADVLFPAIMRLAPINFVFLPVIIFIEATIFYVLFMIDLFFDINVFISFSVGKSYFCPVNCDSHWQ